MRCGGLASRSRLRVVAFRRPQPMDPRRRSSRLRELDSRAAVLTTPFGAVRARAAILTVSTAVLAGDMITLPRGLDPWRDAAARLPLGRNEKLFVEIAGDSSFAPE